MDTTKWGLRVGSMYVTEISGDWAYFGHKKDALTWWSRNKAQSIISKLANIASTSTEIVPIKRPIYKARRGSPIIGTRFWEEDDTL